MYNAVIDTTIGYVKRYGYADFTTDGSFDPATKTQVALNDGQRPVVSPLWHNALSAGNQALADAAVQAIDEKDAVGALTITLVYPTMVELPSPPPKDGLLAIINDVGGGVSALVVSVNGAWRRVSLT